MYSPKCEQCKWLILSIETGIFDDGGTQKIHKNFCANPKCQCDAAKARSLSILCGSNASLFEFKPKRNDDDAGVTVEA